MIFSLILVAFIVGSHSSVINGRIDDLDRYWNHYKSHYNKVYTDEEEYIRKQIFAVNLRKIIDHNIRADLGKHSYRLGVNKFADLTSEEFSSIYNGYRGRKVRSLRTFMNASKSVPDTVDWRTKNLVTEVKNQQQCGSCWAFSAVASLEGQHAKKTGKLVSLSEQNLVDCSKPEGNLGCNGGLMDNAFQYVKDNNGIDTEKSYPYEGKDGKCRFKKSSVGATLTSFVDVKSGSEQALKEAVAEIGPISVAIDATDNFQLYGSGVFDDDTCSTIDLDHGVTVVGYGVDEATKDEYWLVKNSWGADWGEDGYIRMSRNKKNQCGIATEASYPVV